MPFRFRKIFSFGKGLRVNLSKGGASVTAGKPGATVTIGKQGMTGNVGAPGTGLSYRSQISKTKTAKNSNTTNMIIGFVVIATALCCICVSGIYIINNLNVTPTPTSTIVTRSTEIPIQATIRPSSTPYQCDCSANIYNCSDFITQQLAQACFNYCLAQGVGDIHELDQNGNGIACE